LYVSFLVILGTASPATSLDLVGVILVGGHADTGRGALQPSKLAEHK
jgi:hypothetical protein